jgi:hypothetical protein
MWPSITTVPYLVMSVAGDQPAGTQAASGEALQLLSDTESATAVVLLSLLPLSDRLALLILLASAT